MDLFACREKRFSFNPRNLPPLGVDALAHTPWPRVLLYAFPPLQLILPLLERVRQERLSLIIVAPENRSALWFPELAAPSRMARWPVLFRPDALSQAHDGAPPARCIGTAVGLVPERLILQGKGLPEAVINTIQGACAPSTSSHYPAKWCAFSVTGTTLSHPIARWEACLRFYSTYWRRV